MQTHKSSIWVLILLLSAESAPKCFADPMPNTKPLTDTHDLARVMVDGIHAYLDRELKDAPRKRDELWKADFASKEALAKGKRTFRSLRIQGKEVEFTEGFTDLHTESYKEILSGRGFRLQEARASIEVAHRLRSSNKF